MMLSSPRCAASRVRATGASANATPTDARRSASVRATATVVVLKSTMMDGRFKTLANPSAPMQTCSTCRPPGSDKKTISARSATSCNDLARRALVPSNAAKAAEDMSKAITSPGCLSAMLRHMAPPITPRPTKPITGCTDMVRLFKALVHPHAAADVQRCTRDPVRRGGTQEQRGLRDILSVAIAPERYGRIRRRRLVAGDARPHRRFHRSRRQDVGIYAMRRTGLGDPSHHAVHGCFGCHIGGTGSDAAVLGGDRATGQDLAVAAFAHRRKQLARGVDDAHDVHCKHRVPFLVAALRERRAGDDSRTEHQDIDLAVISEYGVDHLVRARTRGHVIAAIFDPSPDIFVFGEVGRDRRGTGVLERMGNRTPHAARSAGNQGHLPRKTGRSAQMLRHVCSSPYR